MSDLTTLEIYQRLLDTGELFYQPKIPIPTSIGIMEQLERMKSANNRTPKLAYPLTPKDCWLPDKKSTEEISVLQSPLMLLLV